MTERLVMQKVLTNATGTLATEVLKPVTLDVLEGTIPDRMKGVMLRNGPGRSERGGVSYGHPFDGDGFIQRLAIANGVAQYSARYIQTREFLAEEAAGRILFRGFGTNRPGGWWRNLLRMRFKNAANTSVVQHAGKTLVLWEGGVPHAIDPDTLETLGRFDYSGALLNRFSKLDSLLAPDLPFAAHPSIDPETGELFNFGTVYGMQNRLLVHRATPEGDLSTRVIPLKDLPFVHDMVLTKRFIIFMLPRAVFNVPAALLGFQTPVNSLRLEKAPGTALLVPRDGGPLIRIPTKPGFVFHWAAAWEDGDRITVEGVKYPGFPALDEVAQLFGPEGAPRILAKPVRITLDLSTGTSEEQQLADCTMELPSAIGSGPERILIGVGAPAQRKQPFFSALIRIGPQNSVTLRDLYPDLPGEPLHTGEHILVPLYRRGGHSEVWILDPDTLQTVCRLGLPHPVPPPLHGIWIPAQP